MKKTKKSDGLATHAKKWKLDAYEQELLQAFEAGKLKPAKNKAALMKETKIAAKRYFEKKARLNIRLTEADLQRLKRKAVMEGLPYQTLAASVLHKYVTQNPVS
jgi:predicted DNA binding CopG/RHH family protein